MSKQLTAVEWLEEQYKKFNQPVSPTLFEEAKARERQQIINAYNAFYIDETVVITELLNGEKYFNDNFSE